MSGMPMHDCQPDLSPQALLRLLQNGDMDAAIEAGLMRFRPCAACEREDASYPSLCAPILEAQQRLSRSWAARDRYRARQARFARRAAEREARRAPATALAEKKKAALPPSAAAILARAKAKAAERHR